MKITVALSTCLFIALTLLAGCGEKRLQDVDGNNYRTVTIGGRTWMAENLKVTRYRNGDPIPEVQDPERWATLNSGAWCTYEHKTENGTKYGRLYNWHAINDPRELAPEGWHVATGKEWDQLAEALGGEAEAGGKMKAKGEWEGSGVIGEPSGFDALPAGARRDADGQFLMLGQYARFWSANGADSLRALGRAIGFFDSQLREGPAGKRLGFSVRCVRNQ